MMMTTKTSHKNYGSQSNATVLWMTTLLCVGAVMGSVSPIHQVITSFASRAVLALEVIQQKYKDRAYHANGVTTLQVLLQAGHRVRWPSVKPAPLENTANILRLNLNRGAMIAP